MVYRKRYRRSYRRGSYGRKRYGNRFRRRWGVGLQWKNYTKRISMVNRALRPEYKRAHREDPARILQPGTQTGVILPELMQDEWCVAQGNTAQQRVGGSILLSQVQWNLMFYMPAVELNDLTTAGVMAHCHQCRIRILWVLDRQPVGVTGANPAIAEVLEPNTLANSYMYGPYNVANRARFKILADKTVTLTPNLVVPAIVGTINNSEPIIGSKNVYVKLTRKVAVRQDYISTGGNYSNQRSNALVGFIISDWGGGGYTDVRVEQNFTTTFTDS